MAHLVLGYPTLAESLRTADRYVQAGCAILELQIPFSHPTADGPVITAACREAVENQKVSMEASIDAIRQVRERYPEQEIVVMSYVNRVFAYGLDKFVQDMHVLGVQRLIIPDLPVDSPLADIIQQHPSGVRLVPVLAANATDERLDKLMDKGFDLFYLMSDFKITGSTFSLNPRLQTVIARIRSRNAAARIGIGFGISTPEQARLVTDEADLAIIGSALITAQSEGRLDAFLTEMKGVWAERA